MLVGVPNPLFDELQSRLVLVAHTPVVRCSVFGTERLGSATGCLYVEPRWVIRHNRSCQDGKQGDSGISQQHGILQACLQGERSTISEATTVAQSGAY
jgi:hypothetical protein